jgi:hypothetical protein
MTSAFLLTPQGGPMAAEEIADFERKLLKEKAIKIRLWDEAGKVKDKVVPSFEHYRPILERLVLHPNSTDHSSYHKALSSSDSRVPPSSPPS